MADSANFAANLQAVPSIFEITASETLDNLIYPALSKICSFLGLRLNLNWKNIHFKEDLSPVVTALLQYLYLKKRGGSFGEAFYGLQRDSLTRNKRWISVALLIGIPYVEAKLKAREANHEGYSYERYALNVLNAFNVAKVVHIFMYLAQHSSTHSPIFRMLGMTLGYPQGPPKKDKSTYFVLKSLEVMAFFLQFLQWWYNSSNQRQNLGSLKDPEPIDDKNRKVPNGKCPICIQDLQTPTACSVSGYVYCWRCIVNHLKVSRTCPVTRYPITIDDLIRIYEN